MRLIASCLILVLATPLARAQEKAEERSPDRPEKADKSEKEKKPDFPPFDEVAKDFEKVVSTAEGTSFYGLWQRKKDGQMLAELPAGFEKQKQFFALTVPTGEEFAGLQLGERLVTWKRFDKRVALVEPNLQVRSSGDQASKDSLENHFADRVLVDVPIVCMGPGGQPVIDLDELLVGNLAAFYGEGRVNRALATIRTAKAFPKNIEVAFEVPTTTRPERAGLLQTFHYSISEVPSNPSYKPRKADGRVGYFTTSWRDLGKFRDDEVWQRSITRWHLEKADPSLKLSPPREPIVFYLEHTVPVRYRRFVKDGVLAWNAAFEKIGISDALVVHYQDKASGAHMEKDPEDVRYNFIRWLSNDIGTAIGPSRAHPETGQILDADVVLTDGWIRHFWHQANEFLPQAAMEGMSAETLRWLDQNPDWDPRVRLAGPRERDALLLAAERRKLLGPAAYEAAFGDGTILANPEVFALATKLPTAASLCMAAEAKAHGMAFGGLALSVLGLLDGEAPEGASGETIDGIPEWFLGPVLTELVSHEVGHTLGLRHNFKASSIYSLAAVNSPEIKGKKPYAGSVMDYLPINVVLGEDGKLKGDIDMIAIGPYDHWAIEYGYTFDDPAKVLARVAEPELAFATDEDTGGPDPLARRYDFAGDPLDFAKSRMALVELARGRILDTFVKPGEPWARARWGYLITLQTQVGVMNMMAGWLGGSFVNRDHKGDPGERRPLEPVPADMQRRALAFVLEHSFPDRAYGLSTELLGRMSVERWWEDGSARQEPTWDVHDRVAGVQATVMTLLLNPTTLRRVHDLELAQAQEVDVLTLPELLDTVSKAAWEELGFGGNSGRPREAGFKGTRAFTVRAPAISSLRRNLQREHLQRMIDLALQRGNSASTRSIALLARLTLENLAKSIDGALGAELDAYTRAHLSDAKARIAKALDATYSYGPPASGSGGTVFVRGASEAEPR
ncbi:MAG TPA: zinc-dependent metalloprotease [Planctomycetota bacterium]